MDRNETGLDGLEMETITDQEKRTRETRMRTEVAQLSECDLERMNGNFGHWEKGSYWMENPVLKKHHCK